MDGIPGFLLHGLQRMPNTCLHDGDFLGILKENVRRGLGAFTRGLTNGAEAFKMGYRKRQGMPEGKGQNGKGKEKHDGLREGISSAACRVEG